jgi:hypothetical protein
MSRRRHRRGGRSNAVKTWVVAVLASAILGTFAVAGGYLYFSKRPIDRVTGCPTDRYDSVTAVLVDLTDPVSPTQAAAIKNTLLKIRNDVPKYGRLEIYPLESTAKGVIQPLFAGCSPGSGRDVDSRIYGNPELADRLWRKQFADKVDGVLSSLLNMPEAETSPIFEAIQSVAVTAFGTPIAESAREKTLVVVSDMIQHTAELSLYRGAPPFERFKTTQYYLRVKPFLKGANVDVDLIVRETRREVQKPPLYKFWVDFIAASGGYLRDWKPMQ